MSDEAAITKQFSSEYRSCGLKCENKPAKASKKRSIPLLVSSCYRLWVGGGGGGGGGGHRGIVSVVCCVILSKGIEPFM